MCSAIYISRYLENLLDSKIFNNNKFIAFFSAGIFIVYSSFNIRYDYLNLFFSKALSVKNSLSFKKSFHELKNISSSCHGIMTLENTFFGAFIIKNNQKIHSIYEIPPFGKYNDSQYKGLRSDRIDCLFISYDMETGIGSGTTINNRYKKYRYIKNDNIDEKFRVISSFKRIIIEY